MDQITEMNNAPAPEAERSPTDDGAAQEAGQTDDTDMVTSAAALRQRNRINAEVVRLFRGLLDAGGIYSGYDPVKELAEPRTRQFLGLGFSPREAYEAIHARELITIAMQAVASRLGRPVQSRPTETAGSSAVRPGSRVAAMSAKERAALERRAATGERITL